MNEPPELPPELIEYAFPLRRDLLLRLELPADLSDGDVDRLAQWMRALCFPRLAPPPPPAFAELAPAPAPPSPPPALPPAPRRMVPKVFMVAGGGRDLIDLWSTALASPSTTASRDEYAARIVSGEIDPWDVIEAFAGRECHKGAFGGATREGAEIVSFQRANAVLVQSQGAGGYVLNNDPDKPESEWTIAASATIPTSPIRIQAFAPAGSRIFRVAWACIAQPLKLTEHEPLPAPSCKFTLAPTKETPEIAFFYAIWIG